MLICDFPFLTDFSIFPVSIIKSLLTTLYISLCNVSAEPFCLLDVNHLQCVAWDGRHNQVHPDESMISIDRDIYLCLLIDPFSLETEDENIPHPHTVDDSWNHDVHCD